MLLYQLRVLMRTIVQLLWGYDTENDAELQAAYNAAVDAGITFFDTGDSYGTGALEGQAEKLLGKFQVHGYLIR